MKNNQIYFLGTSNGNMKYNYIGRGGDFIKVSYLM